MRTDYNNKQLEIIFRTVNKFARDENKYAIISLEDVYDLLYNSPKPVADDEVIIQHCKQRVEEVIEFLNNTLKDKNVKVYIDEERRGLMIEKLEQETIQKNHFEEFVKFNIGGELLPYQKQMLNFIENKKNISEDEFRTQYMIQPFQIGKTFKNTKRKDRKQRCGDCTFFGDKGCTTSELEAKYGNFHTPACSEFSPKILGTKATMIIVDDTIKKD